MQPNSEPAKTRTLPHQEVTDLLEQHLSRLDQATPSLIDGLYLTGSIALGDYQHGISDIDFLALTTRPLDEQDLAEVAAIHEQTTTVPHLDGIYLDRGQLTTLPDNEQAVPHAVNGVFYPNRPCGELNPVLWLTLARYGIRVRGQRTEDLSLNVDAQRLRTWNLNNLKTYWQPFAANIRQAVAGREPDATTSDEAVAWAVLGPARLHYTLATNEVISKSAAGTYAAQHFPRWASLAERAVGWRQSRSTEFGTTDAVAAAAMIDAITEDAWKRWG
jgi:Nucleotidyltransferase domain/Aminoglycoside adenylyltransferase, C-terminal domain